MIDRVDVERVLDQPIGHSHADLSRPVLEDVGLYDAEYDTLWGGVGYMTGPPRPSRKKWGRLGVASRGMQARNACACEARL